MQRSAGVDDNPRRRFASLVDDVAACAACEWMTHAHVLSAANGPLDAGVLFIAEAVGRRGGAVTGVPLTRDESGRRFAAFLRIAGIERGDCFITNTVLCNPVDPSGRNRPPTAAEIARCRPFLERTLELVGAPVIVTLGRVALEATRAISPHDGRLPYGAVTPQRWQGRVLVPLYHPSRQATLHRPHARQEQDWRELAAVVASTQR